jgi:hypothetical protein
MQAANLLHANLREERSNKTKQKIQSVIKANRKNEAKLNQSVKKKQKLF